MARSWTQFEQQVASPPYALSEEAAKDWVTHAEAGNIELWVNNLYLVLIYRGDIVPCDDALRPRNPVWLSIRRVERGKLPRDWRDLQRIKNEILGTQYELVELFPAEERLVDEADQTHLWGFESVGARFPFGYTERVIGTPEQAESLGGTLREFEYKPGEWHHPPARERREAQEGSDA